MNLAVMVQSGWTIPPAIAVGIGLLWYWLRLGRSNVPPSRRRIRRINTALLILLLAPFVRGLSFLDPTQQPREFAITWTVVFIYMLVVMLLAVLDAINSLRLHQDELKNELHEAAGKLARAIEKQRDEVEKSKSDTRNSK